MDERTRTAVIELNFDTEHELHAGAHAGMDERTRTLSEAMHVKHCCSRSVSVAATETDLLQLVG